MSSQLEFYLARAAEARADAEASTLANVRERCLRAAAAWDAMAARAQRGDAMRARQEADKLALAETAAAATPAE
jgi:DNA-binding transcriptional regulator YdaS (Cro superfamily)